MRPNNSLSRLGLSELVQSGDRERLSGLKHVVRLLGMVDMSLAECENATTAFLENIKKQEELENRILLAGRARAVHPHELDPTQRRLWQRGARLAETAHFRIESFYALARLLLDRVADAFDRYFAPVEPGMSSRHPPRTHLDMEKNLQAFGEGRQLERIPERLIATAGVVTRTFFSADDMRIRLGGGRQPMVATLHWASGDASMAPLLDSGVRMVCLEEMREQLRDYVAEVVTFIRFAGPAE